MGITNTEKNDAHPEWLLGKNPNAIEDQEKRGHYINDDPNEDPDEIMIFSDQIKKSCAQYIKEGVEELKNRNSIKNELIKE